MKLRRDRCAMMTAIIMEKPFMLEYLMIAYHQVLFNPDPSIDLIWQTVTYALMGVILTVVH